jgi:hypothetical protein
MHPDTLAMLLLTRGKRPDALMSAKHHASQLLRKASAHELLDNRLCHMRQPLVGDLCCSRADRRTGPRMSLYDAEKRPAHS